MLRCFLGLRSFDSPKRSLAHKQAFLPIVFGGIGFIPTTTIALATYLKSWALVASIIVVKFMVDQHPLLLETLTWIGNNTFLFQQHLKMDCNLLLPPTHACLLPFEQLIRQQMVWLQNFISKCLHHHTLFSIFFDRIYEPYCVQILSCFGLGVNAWLIIRTTFPTFWLSSSSFSTMF